MTVSHPLITRSPGMSIRMCAWPECDSRFPTAQGPSSRGWKIFGMTSVKLLLCPYHSDQEHSPVVTSLTREGTPARFACACDRWAGSLVDSAVSGIREWQHHVAVTLGDGGTI